MYRDVGATWWKVDFHAHSPASFDYGAEKEGGSSSTKPSFEEWLQTYMDAGVDALVITDHNSAEGVLQAREALAAMRPAEGPRLEATPPCEYREIAIFTGVELTVATGIHLLGVFDIDTPPTVITKILTLAGYDGAYGHSREAAPKSISDVARIIHDNGGLAIPAHADGPAGLLNQTSTGLSEVEKNAPIFAIETIDSTTKFDQVGFRNLVRILGSDAHHLNGDLCPEGEDAKYPGSHFTWVKMEIPNLAGIRNALSDSANAIRPSDSYPDAPAASHACITKVSFGATELKFSPWLNTIIGGRAVGKSTAVELIRVALDRFSELPEDLANDLRWFSPNRRSDNEHRAWSRQGVPKVTYVKDGHTYRISWDEITGAEVSEARDGAWQTVPGDVKSRFPIRIYSQKQIFELAKQPQALLGIIDASPEVDFASWSSEDQLQRDEYHKLLAEANGYRDVISTESRVAGQIQDLERRISAAETLSTSPTLSELKRLQDLTAVLDEALEASAVFDGLIKGVKSQLRIPSAIQEKNLNKEPQLADAVHSVFLAMSDTQNTIDSMSERFESRLSKMRDAVDTADIQGRIASLQQQIATESGGESPEAVLKTLTQVAEWRDELNEAIKERNVVQQATKLLAELEPKLRRQRATLASSRQELSKRRSTYLASLESSTPNVEVRLHPMGNSGDLEANWRQLLKKDIAFEKAFSHEGFFKGIPDGRNPQFVTKIEVLKNKILELVDGKNVESIFSGSKIDGRLVEHIRTLSRSDQEAIDTWFPEDSIHVRYKSRESSPWKPISEGSPGQRTAALLAFVLSMGTEPLILDQPEDDLENQLIYSLVVETLRTIKSCRQVIVVTHNANIVVNGNAENVIVLQNSAGTMSIQAAGALERTDVRGAVCQILEGGETAFTKRFERLGIKLPSHIGALR